MVVPVTEILFSPTKTFETYKDSLTGSAAFFIELSAWISFLTGTILILNWKISLEQFAFYFIIFAGFITTTRILKALIIHFFAELLGGVGRASRFIVLLSYADLPLHLFLPIGLLIEGGSVLWFAISFIIIVGWCAYIGRVVLQTHYGLSWGKSFIAAWAPPLFLIGLPAVIAGLGGLLYWFFHWI